MRAVLRCCALAAAVALAPTARADDLAFVTNEGSGDLSVIALGAQPHELRRVPLGKRPRGLRVSPDRRWLYVALSGKPAQGPEQKGPLPPSDPAADGIAVLDLRTLRRVRTLTGVSDPEQLDLSPDGRRVYVASEDAGRLVVLDARDGRTLANVEVGGEPEGVAASPDGRRVWVTSEVDGTAVAVDTQRWQIAGRVQVGQRPRGLAFAADGTRLFATSENDAGVAWIDPLALARGGRRSLDDARLRPMGIAVAPDGRHLYVTTGRGGALLELSSDLGGAPRRVAVGTRPWGVALSPDGGDVLTADGPSDSVSVVDRGGFVRRAVVPVGRKPWGIVAATATIRDDE